MADLDKIKERLLSYSETEIIEDNREDVLRRKLEERDVVVSIANIEDGVSAQEAELYLHYNFKIPEEKRINGKHGLPDGLSAEAREKGLYTEINKISSSLEEFLPAKCSLEVEWAGRGDLYCLKRKYALNKDVP